MSYRTLLGIIAIIIFVGASDLFAQKIEGFKSYQLLVRCKNWTHPIATFWYNVPDDGNLGRPLMGLHTECAGDCEQGHVTLTDALAKLPDNAAAALRAKVAEYEASRELTSLKPSTDNCTRCRELACNCGYGSDQGFVYYAGPGVARTEPFSNAPAAAVLAVGGRYVYRGMTRTISGQQWFRIEVPGLGSDPELGKRTAWVPGNALTCIRPTAPIPGRPDRIKDSGIHLPSVGPGSGGMAARG